jgi:hypothetical protein
LRFHHEVYSFIPQNLLINYYLVDFFCGIFAFENLEANLQDFIPGRGLDPKCCKELNERFLVGELLLNIHFFEAFVLDDVVFFFISTNVEFIILFVTEVFFCIIG